MEGEIPFNPSIRLGRFPCALAPSALREVVRLFCPDAEQIEARRLLAASADDVLIYHNDSARTYQDIDKTILNPSHVNSTDFGKEFTDAVDGAIYAQPLYMANVTIPGQGVPNVVFVATENDGVYAFDADNPGPALWHDSLINPAEGITSVPTTQGDRQQ